MKIRTVYQKVLDIEQAKGFWKDLLGFSPVKDSGNWCEFQLENIRFAILLNDFGDEVKGSGCVPVFEFADEDLSLFVDRAKKLGCSVVFDGLEEPNIQSIVLRDPQGNEFEASRIHH